MGCSAKLNECIAFLKGGQRQVLEFPLLPLILIAPPPSASGVFCRQVYCFDELTEEQCLQNIDSRYFTRKILVLLELRFI